MTCLTTARGFSSQPVSDSINNQKTAVFRQLVKSQTEDISDLLAQLEARRVFLVTDAGAWNLSGAAERISPLLAKYDVNVFSHLEPNPKLPDVIKGMEAFQQSQADVLLAVGGGSVIDTAKLINHLSAQPAPAAEVVRRKPGPAIPGRPLIAVPTTAGTGSEATHFAVVYDEGVKRSVASPHIRPAHVVLDWRLTENLPTFITAHSGLDALCQAIESIWSINANETSLIYAEEALQLVFNNLENAFVGATPENREALMRGANLAGRAIDITFTTAPHALSYPVTSEYGVPHGAAVALFIAPILLYNNEVSTADCADLRGPETTRRRINRIVQLLGCENAAGAADRLWQMLDRLQCPRRLQDVGITTAEQVQSIVGKVNAERLANNPRRVPTDALSHLMKGLL